jgi:hypothetical protein
MTRNEDLVLQALRKEHTRLSRAAEKAKLESDEASTVGSEFIDIHKEWKSILDSGEHEKKTLERLDKLQKRRDRARKILDKDLVKLFDKEGSLRMDRDALAEEINLIELRRSIRKGGAA